MDVVGLEIAVDDASCMRVVHRVSDPGDKLAHVVRGRTSCANILVDALALHEFHGDERLRYPPERGQTGVIDAGDARMLESRQDARFVTPPTSEGRAAD